MEYNTNKIFSWNKFVNVVYSNKQIINVETNIPAIIVYSFEDLYNNIYQPTEEINSIYISKQSNELTLKNFTPTKSHTITQSDELTTTLTNYIDWTKDNQLILKGGTWIVKDYSSSSPTSITGDNLTLDQPGWENKYLSQLGALISIQKNLQVIYDSLGGVVKRTLVNGETQYTTTINGFDDNFNKQFFNQLQNMLNKTSSGTNRIEQYDLQIQQDQPVLLSFDLPSRNGDDSSSKTITCEISLNVITRDNDTNDETESDYYVLYWDEINSKPIFKIKTGDKQLEEMTYDGINIKTITNTSTSNKHQQLFFNNSNIVITTPLSADDFTDNVVNILTEQDSQGHVVYHVENIDNLILVDKDNYSNIQITNGVV